MIFGMNNGSSYSFSHKFTPEKGGKPIKIGFCKKVYRYVIKSPGFWKKMNDISQNTLPKPK